MAKQHNFGFNNSNISIEISGQNINISIGDKTVPLPLHDVWEYATSNLFSEEDSAINRKLPDRVTNKANNPLVTLLSVNIFYTSFPCLLYYNYILRTRKK